MMTENNSDPICLQRNDQFVLGFPTGDSHITRDLRYNPGGYSIRCPIGTYTGTLRPKEVSFSGFRFMKEEGFH